MTYDPEAAERLARMLDIAAGYEIGHDAREAAALIRAQAAEIERLEHRVAEWRSDYRSLESVHRIMRDANVRLINERDARAAPIDTPAPEPAPDALRKAVEEIARQKKTTELVTACDVEYADFEDGYDMCIDRARAALAAAPAPQPAPDGSVVLTMLYRNWRGEIRVRTIKPLGLRYGTTKWHPDPGWLLTVWDFDKEAERDFALSACQFAALAAAPAPQPEADERERRELAETLDRADQIEALTTAIRDNVDMPWSEARDLAESLVNDGWRKP